MTKTDDISQEKKEEEDSPSLGIAKLDQNNDSRNTFKGAKEE